MASSTMVSVIDRLANQYRSDGVGEYRSTGVVRSRSNGVLEYWSIENFQLPSRAWR
jgi:hypothetical protein